MAGSFTTTAARTLFASAMWAARSVRFASTRDAPSSSSMENRLMLRGPRSNHQRQLCRIHPRACGKCRPHRVRPAMVTVGSTAGNLCGRVDLLVPQSQPEGATDTGDPRRHVILRPGRTQNASRRGCQRHRYGCIRWSRTTFGSRTCIETISNLGTSGRTSPSLDSRMTRSALGTGTASTAPNSRSPNRASRASGLAWVWANPRCPICLSRSIAPASTSGSSPRARSEPVTPLRGSILEPADAFDVPTRFSCRSGVCHVCVTRVVAGRAKYVQSPLEQPGSGSVLICSAATETELVLDL